MTDLVAELARRGLVFIAGTPPETEDGTLLVWTGGCDAVVCLRRGGVIRRLETGKPLLELGVPDQIVCWMRLPHPAIWPMVDAPPAEMIPEPDLYSARGDVLTELCEVG